MRKIVSVFVIICFVFSCETESKLEKEIAEIDVTVNVERFDKLFAKATPSSLPQLKTDYPFMFSKQYNDSLWLARLNDTFQLQLNTEVAKSFPDESLFDDDIHSLFQHLKHYFKTFKTPRVITATSFVDYRFKTIVTDTIALLL